MKLCSINTPLQLSVWQIYLVHHPDQQFAQSILRGMQYGFRIGRAAVLKSCMFNMLSAKEHLQVLASYLEEEKKNGSCFGRDVARAAELEIHCSHFGVIPK